jgi:Immunity protein 8
MRPVLINITTIDGDNASKFVSEDGSFSLWLRLHVGSSDREESESFDVLVCSPGWLAFQCERDGFVIGRQHFVEDYVTSHAGRRSSFPDHFLCSVTTKPSTQSSQRIRQDRKGKPGFRRPGPGAIAYLTGLYLGPAPALALYSEAV